MSEVQDEWILDLVQKIDVKRKTSLSEFMRTDLNLQEELSSVFEWYEEILRQVRLKPPDGYATCLTVYEDAKGNIEKVLYNCTENRSDFFSISVIQK